MQQPDTQTLFIKGDSPFHRAHPFTKLAYVLVTGIGVYLLPWPWHVGGGLLILNVGLAAVCRIIGPCWKFLWRTILPLALFMLPIHGILYPDNHQAVFCCHWFCLYREGLLFAASILLKITVLLVAALLFVFTTHPANLITVVSKSTGSPTLAYLFGSPLLLLPSVRKRIAAIQSAQQARGMNTRGNMVNRCRALGPLVMPLVIGALIEIEQRTIALELKGFKSNHPRTALRQVPDSGNQRILRRLMLALCIGLILFRIWRG